MFFADIVGLRVTKIQIPKHIDLREKAQLVCNFEIGDGKLYSVKWYKDDSEFYRYMPDSEPPIRTFPVDGVNLDVSTIFIITEGARAGGFDRIVVA